MTPKKGLRNPADPAQKKTAEPNSAADTLLTLE